MDLVANRLNASPRSLLPPRGREIRLDPAVFLAIGEINHQANHQPDNQARPIDPSEFVHHVSIEQDTQNGYDGDPGSTEGTGLRRIRVAQHHYGDTDDDE